MAGHSHWAQIKRKKSVVDKKRGALWSKLVRDVIMKAREGGGNPEMNFRLRLAIDKAKAANVPRDTIERAIKKATGDGGADVYEEINYEGYGPGGVAIIARALTDNRNRTAGEIRNIFDRNGGNLGTSNSVAWQFKRVGLFAVPAGAIGEEALMEIAIEAGAEDVQKQDDVWQITCQPDSFMAVKGALDAANLELQSAEITMLPTTSVPVDAETGRKVMKLIEDLDENEDVQEVYSNFDMPEDVLAEISAQDA